MNKEEKEIKKAMEIAKKQFEDEDYTITVYSNEYEIELNNVFTDESGMAEFDYDKACEYYGKDIVDEFIKKCNKESEE